MSWTSGCAIRYAAASPVWIRAGYAHFDTMAARMVDAQAPGLAGMLRSIPAEFASVGWPSRVLEQLGALHLLIQAHRRLDDLPSDLAATVRARIGYLGQQVRGPGHRRA